MKNLFFFVALVAIVTLLGSCNNQESGDTAWLTDASLQEVVDIGGDPLFDDLEIDPNVLFQKQLYLEDSVVVIENQKITIFDIDKAEVYFIKNWNTPDYDADERFTGILWDGFIFYGRPYGDFVYYISHYIVQSEKWRKESGDSVFLLERKLPKDGVTKDPRLTAWWLSTINDVDTCKNLEAALRELTCVRDINEFDNYIERLKEDVLKCVGKSFYAKLLSYTSQVNGDPSKWDAWENPGYYKLLD